MLLRSDTIGNILLDLEDFCNFIVIIVNKKQIFSFQTVSCNDIASTGKM
jgi:hypothetical protein